MVCSLLCYVPAQAALSDDVRLTYVCLTSVCRVHPGGMCGWDGHGRQKLGVCRGSDIPTYLCGGDTDMYIP